MGQKAAPPNVTAKSTKADLFAEVQRLRKRTHELADRANQQSRGLISQVARYRGDFDRAREMVRHVKADWTADPPSQEELGFWRYSSQNTITCLAFMAKRIAELEAERDRMRLRAEMSEAALLEHTMSDTQITADEAKRIRLAMIFGDPAVEGQADPALEVAKAKLSKIEQGLQ